MRRMLGGGDVVFMMMLVGFESGRRGRKAWCEGIEGGRTTAVKETGENRREMNKMVNLIVLSRYSSTMTINDTQCKRDLRELKSPTFSPVRLCFTYSTVQATRFQTVHHLLL